MADAENQGVKSLKMPGSFLNHAESSRAPLEPLRTFLIAAHPSQPHGLKRLFHFVRSFWPKKAPKQIP
jgi:hypothetical protein